MTSTPTPRLLSVALVGAAMAVACFSVPAAQARTTQTAAQRPLVLTVDWGDAMSSRESGLWIGYLFARMDYIQRNGRNYSPAPGAVAPTFEEEVFARGEAAKIYRNMKAKGTEPSPYFEDLERVESAGYMREYVWQFLRGSAAWSPPVGLRSAEFDAWRARHLANHTPQTRGRVVFEAR